VAEQRLTAHDRAIRNQKALDLHLAGASYRTISEQLNISLGTAHTAVKEALASRVSAVGSEMVDVELARLDAMLMGLWPDASKGNVNAVDRVLKIGERRTQLLAIRGKRVVAPEAPPPPEPVSELDEFRRRSAAKRANP
jgi:hypothetical protein